MAHVRLDGLRAQEERLADPVVRVPLGHERQNLALAVREVVETIWLARSPHETRNDGGIENTLAVVDPAKRVDEDGDVRYTLLEQVPAPLGMLLEQPHRVTRLEVVREHEDADLRV